MECPCFRGGRQQKSPAGRGFLEGREARGLQALFAVDEDGLDGEVLIVQDGDVGDVAGLDAAEDVAEAVLDSLVVRGALDELAEAEAGDLVDVLEGDVHAEDGAGEGAGRCPWC